MKKLIVSAAIMVASSYSGAIMAHNPATIPDLQMFMSGATAMDNSITQMFQNLCQPGTLDTYFNGGARPGNAYRAFFCTLSANEVPGLSSEQTVLFVKRSAGGSAQGVNPLIEEAQLDAMNIFNNNCAETATGSRVWHCTINPGTGDLEPRHPNIGISDVDPLLFRGDNTPAGFNPVTPAGAQQLDVRAVAALLFGVPVTNGLYNALQKVQIDMGQLPSSCNIGDYTEACMPSLSKHQVASLISGQIKNWDEFRIDNGTPGGVEFTNYPGIEPPTDNKVHFCRRVAGSGTGAQQIVKFLHNPCTEGALEPLKVDNTIEGPRLIINSGSGDVDLCLDDFAKGANRSGTNGEEVVAWAIGQQSLEKNADLAFDYKFVKIDGVAPTLRNAANGSYMDWVEPTYQWRKAGAGAPAGDILRIIEKMVVDAGEPTSVATILNASSNYPFGKSGYLAVASNGHPFSHVLNEDAPVMGYSHAGSGTLNNCNVPVLPASNALKPFVTSFAQSGGGGGGGGGSGPRPSLSNDLSQVTIPCLDFRGTNYRVLMNQQQDILHWVVVDAVAAGLACN